MSEDKDNENEFERDFSDGTEEETTLNDDTSALIEEDILETDDQTLTNGGQISEKEIDPIAEANESLITMNSAPFDQTIEIMSQTLASIDAKMDVENSQLQKLDQLSEIKEQLSRIENVSLATATANPILEPEINAEIEEVIPQNNIGHNQQEISELLEKIEILEKKILTIENQSKDSNKRFEEMESIVERFENLESEIQIEYEEDEKVEKKSFFKNFFKKKDKTEPYKKNIEIDNPKILLTEVKKNIPKHTENIIEEAENNLENITSEILINEDYKEEQSKVNEEDKVTKSKNINNGFAILILLSVIIIVLFYFDKYQIVDLSFINFISFVSSTLNSISSTVDSFLK